MTSVTATAKPNGTIYLTVAGQPVGKITPLGTTYRAARRNGTPDDIRRVSTGFRTTRAATAWIAKSL
jgi:hypothetical protein